MMCPICDAWNEDYETHCVECDSPLDGEIDYDDEDNYGLYGDEEDHY